MFEDDWSVTSVCLRSKASCARLLHKGRRGCSSTRWPWASTKEPVNDHGSMLFTGANCFNFNMYHVSVVLTPLRSWAVVRGQILPYPAYSQIVRISHSSAVCRLITSYGLLQQRH